MKNILGKSLLVSLCLLALNTTAWARTLIPAQFTGQFSSLGPSGSIFGVDAISDPDRDGNFYGTFFTRDDHFSFDGRVDRFGKVTASYNDDNDSSHQVSGKIVRDVLTLMIDTGSSSVEVIAIKTRGYAPTSLPGHYVYFQYINPSVGSSYTYVYLYFYPGNKVKADIYYNGWTNRTGRYTYRKTGPNTATVTLSGIPGLAGARFTYNSIFGGTLTGPGFSLEFETDDFYRD